MIIVTTNEIPGYRITAVLGEAMGLTVRSRNFGSQLSASFRSLGGGELPEMTQSLYEARIQSTERLVAEAAAKGGNAVVGTRFDTSSIGETWTEICAYGTAVIVEAIPAGQPGSTPQSAAHAAPAPQPQHPQYPQGQYGV